LAGSGIQIQANGQINATASALTSNVNIGNLVTGTSVSNSYVTTGNVTAGNIVATGIAFFGSGVGGSVTGANLISANNIVANTAFFGSGTGGSVTGANLISANNIVANTAFFGSGTGGSMTGANLISANNIVANTAFFGSGVGGSVTGANLISANNIQGINWLGLYTANVIETAGNLYFTNARVVSALSTDATIVIEANGQIRSNTSAGAVSLDGLTTANLAEGGANLYFSNARVVSALANTVTTGNINVTNRIDWPASGYAQPSFTTRSAGQKITLYPALSGSAVDYSIGIDGGVLWSTVPQYSPDYSFKWYGGETAVASLSGIGALTVATANIVSATASNSKTTGALTVAGGVGVAGNVYAENLFANGLIIRNITVQDSALTGSTSANNIVADSITSNSYTTTGNIIASNVIAGNVFANGLILRNITILGTGIYRPYIATFKGNSQVTTLNLPVTPANNNYVTVIINGVTQLSNAYTLSGNVITLSGAPATNADIDVRIVEVEQTVTKDFNSRLFYGNSVANTTLISSNFTDSSILVFENGVAQVPGIDYSVNNGLLRFTTPPRTGVTVEIRELPTLFGTGTYLGGKNTEILANGQINSNITVGQNLTISANGQINAIVQEQIHPFLLSLL
jgi:hypothetical protein